MCTYRKVQVWLAREMQACPLCGTATLQYVDAYGDIFCARGFTEAEDGAIEFDDVFLGKDLEDIVWDDLWELLRDDQIE